MEVDTSKVFSCGSDIKKLGMRLGTTIENLFSEFDKITISNAWVGSSAEEFVSKAKKDKETYIKLKDNLYKFGIALCDNSGNYIEQINKTNM